MSKDGQVFMQMLPAVGREDIHANQREWQIRAPVCEVSDHELSPVEEIVAAARETRVVIINEAHDRPRHREFIRKVAVALRSHGYSRFAAETFADSITTRVQVKYPLIADGYYSNEPVFGSLLRTVIDLDYRLESYEYRAGITDPEMSPYDRVTAREEGQALNLKEVIESIANDEKILIHVGYSHASEVPIRSFGGKDLAWMANRLAEKTGINPLTIDQTDCSTDGNQPALTEASFRHEEGQFDIVVGHPALSFDQGRPAWRISDGIRVVPIPKKYRSESERVILEVRPTGESPDSVPVDRLLLWPGESLPLLLRAGKYAVSSHFEDSQTTATGTISVGAY